MDSSDALPKKGPEDKQEAKGENDMSMEALLEQSDLALDLPKPGEVREGTIASVTEDEVLVSIGGKSEGAIPGKELTQLSEEERAQLKVGEQVNVYIVSPEGRQGTLTLSYLRAMEEEDWAKAEELRKSNQTYQGTIAGFNKGGLIVKVGRLRGFVPGSQVSMTRRMAATGETPEQRWSNMIGEPMAARVMEVDRERRRLILSERAAAQESRDTLKERLIEGLKEGEVRAGRVTSLAPFGAFVNINGADGLVHLSEISWDHVNHPSEALEVGQEIQVKIISVDRERKRIGLSVRQLQKDPWADLIAGYQVGQLVEGTITRLTKFGAFARIAENVEGLVHISELSDHRVEHPKEVLNEGDVLTLRIIKIEPERRRIGLSLRKVESRQYSDIDYEMAMAEMEDLDSEPAVEAPPANGTHQDDEPESGDSE